MACGFASRHVDQAEEFLVIIWQWDKKWKISIALSNTATIVGSAHASTEIKEEWEVVHVHVAFL